MQWVAPYPHLDLEHQLSQQNSIFAICAAKLLIALRQKKTTPQPPAE